VSETINAIIVGSHKGLIPFQKGILLSNRSLEEMFLYLKDNYKVDYLLTFRLNQDILEIFFSYIRGMGGANDHPTPNEFKFRLKWFILGKNSSAVFTQNQNTEQNLETCLIKPLLSPNLEVDSNDDDAVCLTHQIFSNLKDIPSEETSCDEENEISYSFIEPDYSVLNIPNSDDICNDNLGLLKEAEFKEKINDEAIRYIAGYVAYRFRNKYNLGNSTNYHYSETEPIPDWFNFISRSGLLQPNSDLFELAKILDSEFQKMHGNSLCGEKRIFKTLVEKTVSQIGSTSVPFEVILCLSRTRTYIRLRNLNRKISFSNCKRQLNQKMSKFTNKKL
jgi:hypothetical protein